MPVLSLFLVKVPNNLKLALLIFSVDKKTLSSAGISVTGFHSLVHSITPAVWVFINLHWYSDVNHHSHLPAIHFSLQVDEAHAFPILISLVNP